MIGEGTNIIIVDNSHNRRVIKIKGKKLVKHFKVHIDLSQLIGTEFGRHYSVTDPKTGALELITDVHTLTRAFLEDEVTGAGAEEEPEEEDKQGAAGKDNRDIVDNNKA